MRRIVALVAVLTLTLMLAACGDDSAESDPTTASAAAPSTDAPPTAATAAATTEPTEAFDIAFRTLDVLAADEDIAQYGLTSGGDFDPDDFTPNFCGAGWPADVEGWDGVGIPYNSEDGSLHMEQTLWGWANVASAEAAFDKSVDQVACGSGSFDSEGVEVRFDLAEIDLGEVYGDESYVVAGTAVAQSLELNLIVASVRVENYLVQFTFAAPPDTSDAPDATIFIEMVTERLVAQL